MLKEIQCPYFKHNKIIFHDGLNIILGDDDAKNSIGKSTALMVIDFVQGGNTFLEDDAGAIKKLGPHYYNFCFVFAGESYFYCRSTEVPEVVYVCDKSYSRQGELTIDEYRKKLAELYGLASLESSYRSVVSPFSRIWKKGGLEPDQPFVGAPKEPSVTAISRLIDIFGRSPDIAAEREVINEQKARRKLITGSMNEKIIPRINKTQYKENTKKITENSEQIEKLKQGFGGALNAYEALFGENLRRMQLRKDELTIQRNELLSKIKRLQREISGITPRLATNIALVAEYFPSVNVDRLEQVESFHQKIGSIVKKELRDELTSTQSEELSLANECRSLEQEIQATLESKGMPDDMFKRVFELKESTDKARNENYYFDKKEQLDEAITISNKRLDEIYTKIFLDIEAKINVKLKAFNKVVYGPTRNSSELRIKSESSYSFTSPDDTGTGKSYAGLIGFDVAMLSLTSLPFAIHDSVVYKNIEVAATQRILRILSALKKKQLFLSFDEAKKFGPKTEQRINKFAVLKLTHNELLYNKDWRDKE
ncbi:DUF2326 domain-containing protein [Limnobacter profundi]|uniref:DUF2326 domain-containing protein n=1 Tax=Limnobacter profundi TaxID=2732163 RepID=A0ABX6N4K3_9BURK|nr:DUF2326 domain-containing protein [Limnobacter sp. SAORIC-580]QJR28282.1 DUF2326 domain-containing protein [Limnobacter sp. SAORIC-580]